MSIFSKNLRYLRKRGNHNQEDIALLFRKKANTIGNWENQKSEPALAELMKLAEYFQVSTEDLLLTDLASQSHSLATIGEAVTSTNKSIRSLESYKLPEFSSHSEAKDAGQDAFWLILREMRALTEKVDLLIAAGESAGAKRNSDKSYH
jgi:transcriptional regulator with XRE-family HTH domain